jgi:hypothetical protein
VWDVNLGISRLHQGQGGPDELHGGLLLEAGPDTLGEMKIAISGHVAWGRLGTSRSEPEDDRMVFLQFAIDEW